MRDEGRKTKDERQVRIPLLFGPYGSRALAYGDRLAGYGTNDVFTPLIYARKSGRPTDWGCTFLEGAASFVPPDRPVQLILDVLDYPDSLLAVAACSCASWGVQVFGGAEVFGDPDLARVFRAAVEQMRRLVQDARGKMQEAGRRRQEEPLGHHGR